MRKVLLVAGLLAAVAVALIVTCSQQAEPGATEAPVDVPSEVAKGVRLELVVSGLDQPLGLVVAPGDEERLFVVEKKGRVRILRDGEVSATFLDISDKVSGASEQGLLSLAFHPQYPKNGRLFVDYTDEGGTTRVVEYAVDPKDPDRVDPASASELLSVEQPYSNHNGGLVLFGPDGRLYVALGDGGAGGDPQGNGQNRDTLLATLLRLDVDVPGEARVPADNPFGSFVWSYGLRNPWRFTFDHETGDLYIADVGQNKFEEIDVVPGEKNGAVKPGGRGLNFGWDIMEGLHSFEGEPKEGLTPPVVEYGQDLGCSVTGGLVYRGKALPALRGHYFYSDYCTPFVHSFRYENGKVRDHRDWTNHLTEGLSPKLRSVAAFGEDSQGELYIISLHGEIYRLAPAP